MICNILNCNNPAEVLEICSDCAEKASYGYYTMCIECDLISMVIAKSDIPMSRIGYTNHCKNCSKERIDTIFNNKEKCKEKTNG